jgi:agmatinase
MPAPTRPWAEKAKVWILPVPVDATTSFRTGTRLGPQAIFEASLQVDLLDADVGRPHQAGFHWRGIAADLFSENENARTAVEAIRRLREAGKEEDHALVAKADALGARVFNKTRDFAIEALSGGRIPVIVGGDHASPQGAICAAAEHHAHADDGLGILHIDAHADLRAAYEGFAHSHASIMHNVLSDNSAISKLVQVGIRDFCEEELLAMENSQGRIVPFFAAAMRGQRLAGDFTALAKRAVAHLPENVWISLDVDGLDPGLCPHTGTPVPEGLFFAECMALLLALVESGRRVVGFDLCEVAPGPGPAAESWDAVVGARLLYKLLGFALRSQGHGACQPPDLPRP